ncbi:oxygen-insensitive NADPH nitroreductase [Testudinibacter sp. TR-2022]|uniref:oxygen-insensitive NADPH nitroreductase n=1 Tax=Testudinibacter sp. TR-2022 TaxID=2585029 RepID=UPI00111ACCF0|nr:oxygen-insensitive NADPH nitroreductase [Testudinibacter sp. TR-2022]TNH04975.1 oxygen-insensitive NADPH nitroreductase [Pasteurellaceae bacterium Phil31]TNH09326.1 oxygen-insensitive NADPH nitroreductase [Testudinibacter sp. TR-2022]TNH09620.1 oxygen-insensitive NADPH nitroreductase [Testudinibacter sp. TR-2022]TNH13485.1 oxygen-insensitive NADPH nitroreductase [Testudinibacter sp. TR-2022]TNH19145.1 oxygen-insensitive NADPH nitroreductase [Testudinibacter sp. TR-2022]
MAAINSTIQTALSHRSIRKFSPEPIAAETLQTLFECARAASSSNHLQCVSIIRVTDTARREKLKHYASDQQYVVDAAEFLVFCIDFQRHHQILPQAQTDYTEVLMIGCVDSGIMAQNLLLSAESLGIGGVYIGALRNNIAEVGELLGLPQHVIPLMGLCLGYPAQDPPQKPRLPLEVLVSENQYRSLDPQILQQYDQNVADYYWQRNQIEMNWSGNVIKSLNKPVRPHVLAYLQQQGYAKK